MDLTYLLNMLGLGGPGGAVAKSPSPGMSVPKGISDSYANPDLPPQDSLAEAIGPWETTVKAEPVAAPGPDSVDKTFGDKLSEALSGLGKLETPEPVVPKVGDILAIGRLLQGGMPTALPSLAGALPRRR